MIPDSTNQTLLYVTDKPDWGAPYTFEAEHVTLINRSRNGSEQRARMRNKPRYSMAYQIAAMTRAEFTVRRALAIKRLGTTMAVPLWHAWEQGKNVISTALEVDSDDDMRLRAFKAGGLVYLEQTGFTATFCRIVTVAELVITIAAGNAESPEIAVPAYTAPRLYPVIIGTAEDNSAKFMATDLSRTTQMFGVTEL